MGSQNMEQRKEKFIGGIILLGLGLLFLLSNLDIIPGLGKTWPLILIVIGIALLVTPGKKCEKKKEEQIPPEQSGT
jgi:putative Mn2+ efflux pump MntP